MSLDDTDYVEPTHQCAAERYACHDCHAPRCRDCIECCDVCDAWVCRERCGKLALSLTTPQFMCRHCAANNARVANQCFHCKQFESPQRRIGRCVINVCSDPTCHVCGINCAYCGVLCCINHTVTLVEASEPASRYCNRCAVALLCACGDPMQCRRCCERTGRTHERCERCSTPQRALCSATCLECGKWRCRRDLMACRECCGTVCKTAACGGEGRVRDNYYWCRVCRPQPTLPPLLPTEGGATM